MRLDPATYTLADYLGQIQRGDVSVDTRYQRSTQFWPSQAKSYLIETILLGYPIPPLYLHQQIEPRTLRPKHEVVDGQQRTEAIRAFAEDTFRLSGSGLETARFRGKRFRQLNDDDRATFLAYPLRFVTFVEATEREVREAFRRINSFTTPLNPEEIRHARFQGPFKWLIHSIASAFEEEWLNAGVFGERAVLRMADTKLIAELCHAAFNGITTTNKSSLDALYNARERLQQDAEKDRAEAGLDKRLRGGLKDAFAQSSFYGGPLFKPYNLYSWTLASMHSFDPLEHLERDIPAGRRRKSARIRRNNLRLLEGALNDRPDDEDEAREGPYGEFLWATAKGTNVAAKRKERTRWFYRALTEDLTG